MVLRGVRRAVLLAAMIPAVSFGVAMVIALLVAKMGPLAQKTAESPPPPAANEVLAREANIVKTQLSEYYVRPRLVLGGNVNGAVLTLRLRLRAWRTMSAPQRLLFSKNAIGAWLGAYEVGHGARSVRHLRIKLVFDRAGE